MISVIAIDSLKPVNLAEKANEQDKILLEIAQTSGSQRTESKLANRLIMGKSAFIDADLIDMEEANSALQSLLYQKLLKLNKHFWECKSTDRKDREEEFFSKIASYVAKRNPKYLLRLRTKLNKAKDNLTKTLKTKGWDYNATLMVFERYAVQLCGTQAIMSVV